MAVDYLSSLPATGQGRGAAAYHDKRFAMIAGLRTMTPLFMWTLIRESPGFPNSIRFRLDSPFFQ